MVAMKHRDIRAQRADRDAERHLALAPAPDRDEPESEAPPHTDPWADWTSDSPRVVVGPLDI